MSETTMQSKTGSGVARCRISLAFILALGLIASGCGVFGGAGGPGSSSTAKESQEPTPLTQDDFAERLSQAYRNEGTAHVQYQSQSHGTSYEAEGDIKFAESNKDMEVTGTAQLPSGKADVQVLSKDKAYVNMGQETLGKYLPVDLSDDDDPIAQTIWMIAGTVHDIAGTLDRLDSMMTSFAKSGEPEDIGDVQAQPYTIVLDPSKSDDSDTDKNQDSVYTYTIHVDDDDLIRRVEVENDGNDESLEWEYSDWGEPVEVEEPDTSEIVSSNSVK